MLKLRQGMFETNSSATNVFCTNMHPGMYNKWIETKDNKLEDMLFIGFKSLDDLFTVEYYIVEGKYVYDQMKDDPEWCDKIDNIESAIEFAYRKFGFLAPNYIPFTTKRKDNGLLDLSFMVDLSWG